MIFLLRLRNRWSKDGEKQARFFTKNGWINREKTAMESACFFAPRPLYHNGKKLVNPVLQKVLQDGLLAGETEEKHARKREFVMQSLRKDALSATKNAPADIARRILAFA